MQLFFGIKKDGKIIKYEKSKSFVKNSATFFKCRFFGFGRYGESCNMYDINSATVSITCNTRFAFPNDADTGVFIGNGTSLNWNDYNLTSRLNLTKQGNSYDNQDIVDGSGNLLGRYRSYTTVWKNETGSAVQVTEIGLIMREQGTGSYILLAKDVFDPITVEDGSTIQPFYQLKTLV